ncbi:MAG: TIGR02757 family protein [bacterium]|nr:TIGR02757 family protein [bacterium]
MASELGDILTRLAQKYERKEFLVGDPSWFMHQIEGDVNKELLAFIASALSYGSRRQFMPKIQTLLDSIRACGTDPDAVRRWLLTRQYEHVVPMTDDCFYRLYTCRTFNTFLRALADMAGEYGSMRGYLISQREHDPDKMPAIDAVSHITRWFSEHGSTGVIPKDTRSSCKRVCMFLRWMVRSASPVDLGLWSDIIDRRTLIIPMDTHVVQEAMRLGLLTSRSTSMPNAIRLSERLRDIFPDDPLRGDFALFGLGVDDTAPSSKDFLAHHKST